MITSITMRKKHIQGASTLIAIMLMAAVAVSCIKNDIPYARIVPVFTTFEVEHQLRNAQIDSATCSVVVTLDEYADIQNVVVTDFALSQGELVDPSSLSGTIDLSSPYVVATQLYQTYDWTITAVQNIERRFAIEDQIGASEIDVTTHTVKAQYPDTKDIAAVKVTDIKLAGPEAVMTPDLNGQIVDFTNPVTVSVSEFGRVTEWTITVEPTDMVVSINTVDAWTQVAWVYISAQEGLNVTVQYREEGQTQWMTAPASWTTGEAGALTCCLRHLSPLTSYEVQAVSGDDKSLLTRFYTGDNPQVPNNRFDEWWKNGKVWNPWAENGEPWWDTGNKGATTLGESNTVPTDDTCDGQGQAAKLMSRFVGIGPLGKLAAGNIYAGVFVKVDGTNGILNMGRPFTSRPTRLHGYFKYEGGAINRSSTEFNDYKGQPDKGIVWVALIDADEPYEIRTNPSNRRLFDRNDPCVIAYGEMVQQDNVTEYREFYVDFDYKSTSRVPKYILITASASWLGDYFTGCDQATMWLDNIDLVYDYDD